MLCRQTFGAILGDVVGVRDRRGLRRLRRASVQLVVVGRFDVDRRLPVVVQVPQGRRPHVVVRRRRHFPVAGEHRRVGFHHVAGERGAEVAEPAQDAAVHVAVDVLYHRDLVDLKHTGRS